MNLPAQCRGIHYPSCSIHHERYSLLHSDSYSMSCHLVYNKRCSNRVKYNPLVSVNRVFVWFNLTINSASGDGDELQHLKLVVYRLVMQFRLALLWNSPLNLEAQLPPQFCHVANAALLLFLRSAPALISFVQPSVCPCPVFPLLNSNRTGI